MINSGEKPWNIFCPGPSLKYFDGDIFHTIGIVPAVDPKSAIFYPGVAVNNAIFYPGLRDYCQFWAVQDNPSPFLDKGTSLFGARPVVWCRKEFSEVWKRHSFPVWTHPATEGSFRETLTVFKNPFPFVEFLGLTVTTAMIRAVQMGARTLYIFGCDLQGEGYACGEDYQHRSKTNWEERWKNELQTMRVVANFLRGEGVQIKNFGLAQF